MKKSISLNLGNNMLKLEFNLIKSGIVSRLNWFLGYLNKILLKVINIAKANLCITMIQPELAKNSTIIFIHGKKYSQRE